MTVASSSSGVLAHWSVAQSMHQYQCDVHVLTSCVLQLAFEVLEGLLREDDEVVGVWYLMGWLHYLTGDADSARFYLEHMQAVRKAVWSCD